jgi:hypothetical protein
MRIVFYADRAGLRAARDRGQELKLGDLQPVLLGGFQQNLRHIGDGPGFSPVAR